MAFLLTAKAHKVLHKGTQSNFFAKTNLCAPLCNPSGAFAVK